MTGPIPTTEHTSARRGNRGRTAVLAAVMVWVSAVMGTAAMAEDRVVTRAAPRAASAPVVSPAHAVADKVQGAAHSAQSSPAVAFDGTNYLVVWIDERNLGLMGARVTPGGVVLDPNGFVVANGDSDPQYASPQLSFDGTNFLVVWNAFVAEGLLNLFITRVSRAGVRLDQETQLAPSPRNQSLPTVAFDGTNWVVAFNAKTLAGPYDIHAIRVAPTGVPVAVPFPVSEAAGDQLFPSISSNGAGSTLVVWWDSPGGADDIYGARLNATGGVVDPSGLPISTAAGRQVIPEVSFGGGSFLVVWEGEYNLSGNKIFGTRVTTSGAVLDPATTPFATGNGGQFDPQLVFDGTNWLVTWLRDYAGSFRDLAGFRVNTAGVRVGSPILISAGQEVYTHAVGAGGGNFLTLWSRYLGDIVANRITAAGAVLDGSGIVVSLTDNNQREPAVAFDGTNYLVVWTDDRARGPGEYGARLYGARVRPDGTRLDASGFLIGTNALLQSAAPQVAFDGQNHLVVWQWDNGQGGSGIRAARVSPAGTVLDAPAKNVASESTNPRLSVGGGSWLVVYEPFTPSGDEIRASRIAANGTNLDPGGFVVDSLPPSTQEGLFTSSVSFNGTDHLVIWSQVDLVDGTSSLRGARVSPQAVVRDPDPFTVANGGVASGAASIGTETLVAWSDGCDLYATRVGADGSVLGTSQVAGDPPRCDEAPAVAANGSSYLVAWRKTSGNEAADVMLARVSASGTVQDPGGVAVDTSSTVYPNGLFLDVSAGPGDDWGLVHTKADPSSVVGTTYLRTVAPK